MGQELLNRGVKTYGSLWGASALLNKKYHKTVIKTHLDFINAGAEVIVTNSFGSRKRRLIENNLENKYALLNKLAGSLAKKAVRISKKKVMIAGDSLSLALSFFLIQEKLLLYNLNHYRKSIFATGAIRKEKKYFLDEVGNIDAKTKNINTQLF